MTADFDCPWPDGQSGKVPALRRVHKDDPLSGTEPVGSRKLKAVQPPPASTSVEASWVLPGAAGIALALVLEATGAVTLAPESATVPVPSTVPPAAGSLGSTAVAPGATCCPAFVGLDVPVSSRPEHAERKAAARRVHFMGTFIVGCMSKRRARRGFQRRAQFLANREMNPR